MSSQIIKAIKAASGPKPVGPYSSAVQVNNTLYLSGVVGLDNNTSKLVTGGIQQETEAVFQHIKNILEESGSSLERVATVKVFLDDISNGPVVNEIYQKYLKAPYPARCLMQVAKLPLGAKIEVEVMALITEQCRL